MKKQKNTLIVLGILLIVCIGFLYEFIECSERIENCFSPSAPLASWETKDSLNSFCIQRPLDNNIPQITFYIRHENFFRNKDLEEYLINIGSGKGGTLYCGQYKDKIQITNFDFKKKSWGLTFSLKKSGSEKCYNWYSILEIEVGKTEKQEDWYIKLLSKENSLGDGYEIEKCVIH